MKGMTACHPTLPFGSMVRVVNLDNNRSVVVRITDRGDLIKGRVIDLSYGAAKQLALLKPGIAPVKLEVLSLGGTHRNRSEEHTSELQSLRHLVCRLLLE